MERFALQSLRVLHCVQNDNVGFALRTGLPRLTAAEGFFLLAWPKRNKNPRLASFLVKSYGNLICGSIEALSPYLIPPLSL